MTAEEEFVEFAGAVSPRLQGMAVLLCGDWHTAEDLVQATLVKVFVSWRRVRGQETAHAYATRTLVNTYLAHKRLRRTGEIPTSELPEQAAEPVAPGSGVDRRLGGNFCQGGGTFRDPQVVLLGEARASPQEAH
jgi:DNA-directed RNA polymerase specialized sigma24 family protein